jgi:hypothetical protein
VHVVPLAARLEAEGAAPRYASGDRATP